MSSLVQFRKWVAAGSRGYQIVVLALIPWVFSLAGCHNSCYLFISNPGGGSGIGVSTSSSGCPTVTLVGTMHVAARVHRACEFCSESNRIRKLFLPLNGIELHAMDSGGAGPGGWQELLPELALEPRWFDFPEADPAGASSVSLVERAAVPAGTYDRIRLRLAPNQKSKDGQVDPRNPCGQAGFSCMVMGSGRVLQLTLGEDALELDLAAATNANERFRILPNTESPVLIELMPVWLPTSTSKEIVRLLPRLIPVSFLEESTHP